MDAFTILICFSFCINFPFASSSRNEYVAAVFEHEAFFIPFKKPPTREQALDIMLTNVKVYHEQAIKAKSMKAEIIVFPEDGLHGFGYTRESIVPFLERIPQPSTLQRPWAPCLEPHRYPNTDVLYHLSCIALNLSLAVVANMGDFQPCTAAHDPHCPPDGRYQFNTDVVFDVDGTLLAKYHKQNLFHEKQFNTPAKCEHVIFKTGFGVRFGVFTCFDMLFKSPAIDLVNEYGIRNVVMPTAWMAGFPILVSVQFQQAWSRATCVNLIVANQHQPIGSMYGSGIYSCGEAETYLFNPKASKDQRLMLATLQDLETRHWSWYRNNDMAINSVEQQRRDMRTFTRANAIDHNMKIFHATIVNDIYNAVRLQSGQTTASVCHNHFCCFLDYRTANQLTEIYVLASFNGLHKPEEFYLQVCVLLKCADQSQESCGQIVETSLTVFDYIKLSGNFTHETKVFPEMLVSGMKLVEKDQLKVSGHTVMATQGISEPLISAVLLGRDYSRDKYPNTEKNAQELYSDL